ncbi:FAD-dependent monooxygenase [Gynurincola endophyticus]|uniref:FAD-dependent monooxygenase n=1 Tax=Gynurincola endophyticus TaxID=2479004 RepID=UPI000F8E07F4|nr:FAD-dependent monooxygenase [Gynurincola endophyticus]
MVVGIIGAGIGGLTTAIALLQKGIDVMLFEKTANIEAVGAGIALAPNAMQIFREMGLFNEVSAAGMSMDHFVIADEQLNTLQKFAPTVFKSKETLGLSIGRAALHELLFSKIPPGKVFLHHHFNSFELIEDQVLLHFHNQPSQKVDWLVGADGIHSNIRKQLFPDSTLIQANQICWRGLIHTNEVVPAVSTELWGRGKRFGFSPIDQHTIYWYALVNSHHLPAEWNAQYIVEQFTEYHPRVKNLILSTPADKIVLHPIQELKPLRNWFNHRVVLIGDAAHAMTPNMGQGACQAIIDAYTLAEIFRKNEKPETFQKIRKRPVGKIVTLSRIIGRIAQSESKWLVTTRNFILRASQPLMKLLRF